ncbi:MAG: hypothetical protein EP308_05985 [Burkholderiales bacterium]|nr:MAG: hypothetical protein EP308_05985 [Burkholderiales bacterium]
MQIFTTLDPFAQQAAEKAVAHTLPNLEKSHSLPANSLNAALVIASTSNGEVQALVGGRDLRLDGFNRALDASRPIGSLAKPVVYLSALRKGYTLVTPVDDLPIRVKGGDGNIWEPQNYDHKLHGVVPLYKALSHSYNLATAHLGMDLGLKDVAAFFRQMGVTRQVNPYPSMVLGALQLSPFEVAQLYQPLSAEGYSSPLRAIRAVLSQDGQPLKRYPVEVVQRVDDKSVVLLNHALQQVVWNGTARGLSRYLPEDLGIAGKTGTTDELRDSWFAGFTGNYLAVAWVGRDDNQSAGLSGASGALPIWGEAMSQLPQQALELTLKPGMHYQWVTPGGKLSEESCDSAMMLPFIDGSAPVGIPQCEDAHDQ